MRKILVFSALLFSFSLSAQTTNYQVHSLFVVNIARYSAWPTPGAEFHIAVFGKSKVYDELVKQASAKNINGLPLKVTQAEEITGLGTPNIIFLSDGKSSSLDEVLKLTQGKPVMIIAEREGLFKKGAGFSFVVMENNTLRYDINNTELEKRQIRVSKNLSALAHTTM